MKEHNTRTKNDIQLCVKIGLCVRSMGIMHDILNTWTTSEICERFTQNESEYSRE